MVIDLRLTCKEVFTSCPTCDIVGGMMSDEKRRRRWREAKYRSGERNPYQLVGRTNKSQANQLKRQKEFIEKFGESALERLSSDKERLIVAAYFGLGGGVPTAGTILAKQLGTTRENIHRIIKNAVNKLLAQKGEMK